jgi:predicted RNase H-like nuclease (RuvC/YqgF family)
MNSMVQYFHRIVNGLWYQHQRALDARDEHIADLEMIISNNKHEINQLRSQLDQYQSIFSVYQSLNKRHPTENEHHRSGVSAPPSTLCTLIIWEKSTW